MLLLGDKAFKVLFKQGFIFVPNYNKLQKYNEMYYYLRVIFAVEVLSTLSPFSPYIWSAKTLASFSEI